MSVTTAAKDYLLVIYALAEEGRPVIGARLAERLKVTAPTVHQMLKRLEHDGLIRIEPRRGITLTESGRAIAADGIRRQRLSERWLVEMLGLTWAEAHTAARAMEGAISPHIAERLDAMLGHPSTGLQGSPIPRPGGPSEPPATLWPLDGIEPGAVVVLERIVDQGEATLELLAYLDRHGLRRGVRLTVAAVEPGANTITLQRGDERIVLGRQVAGLLWVRRLTAAELSLLLGSAESECPDESNAFVAEVESVVSDCPAGHRLGDRFVFGQRTPCGMCADAFVELYPHLQSLREGAPGSSLAVPCPEHGNVTFRVRRGLVGASSA